MAITSSDKYVQVAIPVPMRQLFTYKLPEKLNTNAIKLGERVIVPFGSRQVVAIVLAIDEETEYDTEKIKPIISRVNDEFHFSPEILTFLRRCADYYHHPIGDVFQQALPVLLRQIKQPDVELPQIWLTKASLTEEEQKTTAKKSPKQAELLALLYQHQGLTWSELLTLGFKKAHLNALEKKQFIYKKSRAIEVFTWQESTLQQDNRLELSAEQAVIVATIKEMQHQFACHLIDGITGSGKTEVYLQAMELVLSANKQVLVLVPEIGLTPQTLSRFERRFNVPICLHHSGLNNKERLQTWLEAQRGSAAIVIGTRSAIFTPLHDLGMIIVDEEHDASFKQQDSFRYHGRDIAILRARQLNIPILLGSATPSLESLQNALSGRYHYHQLKKRAGKASTAKISLIDVAQQQMEHGLSGTLKQAIKNTLARGEQALIFLNRRGYAPAINCQECHWVADCQRCDKPYTLHQGQRLLICHHCGSQKRIPPQCPSCGSVRIKPLGQGTEQLEEKIQRIIP